jgi:hypothetical protein
MIGKRYILIGLIIILCIIIIELYNCIDWKQIENYSNLKMNYASNQLNGNSISGPTIISGNGIIPSNTDTKYNNDLSKIIDIQYHKTEAQLMKEAQPTDVQFGNTYIYDKNGNTIAYPSSSVQGSITYYTPGSYPFGTANYVPNYENSIYLSKLTGLSTTTPIYNTAEMLSGFCSYFRNQPEKKEKVCNQLQSNECASTNCCVLLGGSKCVSGNERGPSYKTNYGDIFLRNKDFYYYQGKCYGNCQ